MTLCAPYLPQIVHKPSLPYRNDKALALQPVGQTRPLPSLKNERWPVASIQKSPEFHQRD